MPPRRAFRILSSLRAQRAPQAFPRLATESSLLPLSATRISPAHTRVLNCQAALSRLHAPERLRLVQARHHKWSDRIASVIPKSTWRKIVWRVCALLLSLKFFVCVLVLRCDPHSPWTPTGNRRCKILEPCLLYPMFFGRTVENQFTEYHGSCRFFQWRGTSPVLAGFWAAANAQRASANDPPIVQRTAVFESPASSYNQFQTAQNAAAGRPIKSSLHCWSNAAR